jgi:hypothetical protein
MSAGGDDQPAQVVGPAFGAAAAARARHAAVDQAQQCAAAIRCEGDLDDAAAIRVGEVVALPLPAEDDAARGLDL